MAFTLVILFGLLFGILMAIGYYFGFSSFSIILLALLFSFFQWYFSPQIIERSAKLRYLERNENPKIFKLVEEICKKSDVPVPKIAISKMQAPNAFVFGRTSKNSTLVLTKGLLEILDEKEIKAVIGHEIGHIKHKDMIVMTLVGVIPMLAYLLSRSFIFIPSDNRKSSSAFLIGIFAFGVYLLSHFLILLLSRLREYYADRFSSQKTNPKWLIRALIKISYNLGKSKDEENLGLRSFFIADPVISKREIETL